MIGIKCMRILGLVSSLKHLTLSIPSSQIPMWLLENVQFTQISPHDWVSHIDIVHGEIIAKNIWEERI